MLAILLPLILAAAHSPQSEGSYPAVELLSLAKRTCSDLTSVESATKSALNAGWKRYQPKLDDPILPSQVAFRVPGLERIDDRFFITNLGRRKLELNIGASLHRGQKHVSCIVHDYEASSLVAPMTIARWVNSKPVLYDVRSDSRILVWQPGLFEGQDTFEFDQLLPSSAVTRSTAGIMIIMDTKGTKPQ